MRCRQHFQDKNIGGIRVNFSRHLYIREKKDLFTAFWVILYVFFLSSAVFFKINFLKQIFQEYHQSVKLFFILIRPALLSDLIWVQTVNKDCQQMTLGCKESTCGAHYVNDQQMAFLRNSVFKNWHQVKIKLAQLQRLFYKLL